MNIIVLSIIILFGNVIAYSKNKNLKSEIAQIDSECPTHIRSTADRRIGKLKYEVPKNELYLSLHDGLGYANSIKIQMKHIDKTLTLGTKGYMSLYSIIDSNHIDESYNGIAVVNRSLENFQIQKQKILAIINRCNELEQSMLIDFTRVLNEKWSNEIPFCHYNLPIKNLFKYFTCKGFSKKEHLETLFPFKSKPADELIKDLLIKAISWADKIENGGNESGGLSLTLNPLNFENELNVAISKIKDLYSKNETIEIYMKIAIKILQDSGFNKIKSLNFRSKYDIFFGDVLVIPSNDTEENIFIEIVRSYL